MRYVTVTALQPDPDATAHRVSLPAQYVQGPGFTWTGSFWATSLPVGALVQAPGSFVVKDRRP